MDCSKTWLTVGSTGPDVSAAEQKLKNEGYYTGAIDGSYGQYMAQAVGYYQGDNDLSQDGIIGPQTCNKMGLNTPTPTPTPSGGSCPNSQLKEGCTGANVLDWQNFLLSTGCYLAALDSSFGPVMTVAVKEFQRRQGLTKDGWIGDQTINARNTCRSSSDLASLTWVRNNIGTCNNKEDLYNLSSTGKYSFYDDFRYYGQTLYVFWKTGANCCEICEYVAAPILRAMGYKPVIYLVWIVCSDGETYGHYFIAVDGIVPSNGKNCKAYDLAGDAELGKAKRPMGTPICLGAVTIRAIKGAHIPQ